ncbi:MAG: MFS transporter [Bryobacterales bacterium]|nr:MFS transporter [Bryobacterales bacterium]
MTAGDRVSRGGAAKWWIAVLLLAATILNYLDRQVLSLTAEKVMAEFGIGQEGFGRIVAAFRYSYAFVQVGGGWLVDAFGARAVFPLAVGLWSTAGCLTAFAPTLGALYACRFLLGVGEAFNWPCALKATERLLEPKDRPLANGIFNSGTAVGAMLAPVVVTVLALHYGWRAPFLVTGALGFLWVAVWLVYTRGRGKQLAGRPLSPGGVLRVMAAILGKRAFWMLAVSSVVVNSVSYVLADWIPLYLKTERGFSFGAGNVLSMLVYAGLDAGNLLVGFYVRTAVARGRSLTAARNSALFISCLLMSSAAMAGITPSRYLALALLTLTAIGVAGFLVLYLTLVQDLDPLHVGTAAGMLGGLGNFSYGLLSPYIGRLADLHQTAWTFTLVGVLPWLAFLAILAGTRRQPS